MKSLKLILGIHGGESVGWIRLDHDTDQWRAVVNMVMNIRVLYKKKGGEFLD
jgi:hypothetical protein